MEPLIKKLTMNKVLLWGGLSQSRIIHNMLEKTDFTVVLTSAGDNKIGAIKEVRAFTGLGLKEAKDLVEAAPKELKQGVAKKDAEELQKKFAAIGAKVDLK